ncbi:MAG TPA: hypothetical protein VK184_12980 [Nostocaceae cyanobacterium]|nr:hypothetical protein [Nostocaceae cyanobacterium]
MFINLESVKEQIKQQFEELEFTDGRHPKDQIEAVEEIEVEVVAVQIKDISLKISDIMAMKKEYTVSLLIDSEVVFQPCVYFSDIDSLYYDDESDEYKNAHNTLGKVLKPEKQTVVIPVEIILNVYLNDEEEEETEIDSVTLQTKKAIGVNF